jgi:membrane-bound metal-dependent hydrolase YbcI (DUF457 family)
MTGLTHMAAGVCSASAIVALGPEIEKTAGSVLAGAVSIGAIELPVVLLGGVTCVLAALLPDIDEPESLIVNSPGAVQRRMGRGKTASRQAARGLAGVALLILRRLLRMLSAVIRFFAGGHRAATHWLITAALLTVALWYAGTALGYSWLWLWFAAGYSSHLFLDMLTPAGLQVLRPFSRKSMHLLPGPLRIRTGGIVDSAVRGLLLLGSGALLYEPLLRRL